MFIPTDERLGSIVVEQSPIAMTLEDKTRLKSIVLEMKNNVIATYYNNGVVTSECKYPTLKHFTKDFYRSNSLVTFNKEYVRDDTLLASVRREYPDVMNLYVKDIEWKY